MAGTVAPNIVTDGLVLYLDAANSKSYVSGSTTWRDMAGSNNGTLVNGPAFSSDNGGSIVFDGIDDYTTIAIPAESGTINFWFFYSQNTTQKLIMGGGGNMIYLGSSGGGWHWFNFSSGDYSFSRNFGNMSKWVNMTATYSSTTINSMYIDGKLSYSSNTYSLPKPAIYYIASGIYNPQNTKFSLITTYNRALSAQEVLQNYNATKTRFQ